MEIGMSNFVLLWLSRVKQKFDFKNNKKNLTFENRNYTNPWGTLKWWSGGLFEVIIKGSKVSEGPASRSRPPRFDLSRSHADMTSEFFEVKLTAQKVLSSAAKWWTHEHSSSTWKLKTVQIWISNFRKYQYFLPSRPQVPKLSFRKSGFRKIYSSTVEAPRDLLSLSFCNKKIVFKISAFII